MIEIVEVPAVKVPELDNTVPVPDRVMVYKLASRVPAVMVRALETVRASWRVCVPPLPLMVRL